MAPKLTKNLWKKLELTSIKMSSNATPSPKNKKIHAKFVSMITTMEITSYSTPASAMDHVELFITAVWQNG
jgi:hypothetical protein